MTNTRFTRNCPTIETVTTWYNDGAHMSHSTPRCRRIGEPRTHTHRDTWARTTTTTRPANWICETCTADNPPTPEPPVSKSGVAECMACMAILPVTKFPTLRIYGYQVRDIRRCRVCRDNHAPMPDADTAFTVDTHNMPVMGPDWRLVPGTGTWVRIPGSSVAGWRDTPDGQAFYIRDLFDAA